MTMCKYILSCLALLPLLVPCSQAAQTWSVDPPAQPWVFSSEDGGGGGYLGVDINDVSTERLGALKLKEEKGVEVTMVDQDAPAGKAGIKEHDVILTMNGTTVESKAQLQRMIHETPAGRTVSFGLSRDGQPVTVQVQLGDKRKELYVSMPKLQKDFHFDVPDVHVPDIDVPSINMVVVTQSARSGLMMENITPQLGEFFGVKGGNGVLIRSVEKGSRAEKAGFRAGDVIVKVNEQPVHDTSDFSHAVRSRSGDSVSVGVVRDKREQNFNLPLPTRKESSELLDEESIDDQVIDADSIIELGEAQQQLARMRPQLELAEAMRNSAAVLRDSTCKLQKKARAQLKQNQQQLKKQQEWFEQEQDQKQEYWQQVLTDSAPFDI
jgi:serine protease Do